MSLVETLGKTVRVIISEKQVKKVELELRYLVNFYCASYYHVPGVSPLFTDD